MTDNLKHFPEELIPRGIHVLSARQFITDTVGLDSEAASRAFRTMATRRATPIEDILDVLRDRYALHDAVDVVERALRP